MEKRVKLVGPVIRDRELAEALIGAVEADNPGVEVSVADHGGYTHIQTPWRCRITRQSLEQVLGRSIRLPQIEVEMPAFAGRMKYVNDDEMVFYLERED